MATRPRETIAATGRGLLFHRRGYSEGGLPANIGELRRSISIGVLTNPPIHSAKLAPLSVAYCSTGHARIQRRKLTMGAHPCIGSACRSRMHQLQVTRLSNNGARLQTVNEKIVHCHMVSRNGLGTTASSSVATNSLPRVLSVDCPRSSVRGSKTPNV